MGKYCGKCTKLYIKITNLFFFLLQKYTYFIIIFIHPVIIQLFMFISDIHIDQDGPALIGDPDMGFSQLRQFGPTLIHHTQLKVRSQTNTSSFMMIDSPGMIDSPMNQSGMGGSSSMMDRGYDFQGVVRWYAERADVVMLFFDPDKPGTTGETLSVLLHSLGGMDHKLLIVLNKADQFKKVGVYYYHYYCYYFTCVNSSFLSQN